MNIKEQLAPEPAFHYFAGGCKWVVGPGQVDITHPPSAYTKGFEDGARAMAKKMLELFRIPDDLPKAVRLVMAYDMGDARPTNEWKHETRI
jgi:hypothetical protein